MKRLLVPIVLALLACDAPASSSPPDTFQEDTSSAPSSRPERYRPQFHFTPERNWLNDPNGLIFHEGIWHLFYQYNPLLPIWGNIHWGHATSTDLVHWEDAPVALTPDPDLGLAFSGSAVHDADNTSGLCPGGCLVALYTHHSVADATEVQSLAYSTDKGVTWLSYENNPVLTAPANTPDFRDPRVVRTDTGWLMVLAAGDHVELYTSPNLIDWTFASRFDSADAPAGVWECPEWLTLSVEGERGPALTVLAVDITQPPGELGTHPIYWVGSFDGTTFTPQGSWQVVDHGADFYASQAWSQVPDGRTLWLAWMSNWAYALATPTQPWRGAMTLPREVGLRRDPTSSELVLTQRPVAELETLRGAPLLDAGPQALSEGSSPLFEGIAASTFDLELTLSPGTASAIHLDLRVGDGERTRLEMVFGTPSTLTLDRTRSGASSFSTHFADAYPAPLRAGDGASLSLRVVVDAGSVEVFAEDGGVVLTSLIFPAPESTGLTLEVVGGQAQLERAVLYPLKSIWQLTD